MNRMRFAIAFGIAAPLSLLGIPRAHADPVFVLVGAHADMRSRTAAPVLLVRLAPSDATELRVSQAGWTTSVSGTYVHSPGLRLLAQVDATPVNAHQSNLVFVEGERSNDGEFSARCVEGSLGMRLFEPDSVQLELNALIRRERIDGLTNAEEDPWARPYGGTRLAIRYETLRSEHPYRTRIDGFRLEASVSIFAGREVWARGATRMTLGRRWKRLFATTSLFIYGTTLSSMVTDIPIGGSFDVLGADAFYGQPLAAVRAASGILASARLDLALLGDWEIGLRASVFDDFDSFHHGVAIQTSLLWNGLYFYAGAGFPDGEVFEGSLSRATVFGGVTGAWLITRRVRQNEEEHP